MTKICWFSGGVTSAVACKLVIDRYGVDKCRVVFIDTMNEDPDTYRFKSQCQDWYGVEIEAVKNDKYTDIQSVWHKYNSLNVAKGAICSTELKRSVREKFQKENGFSAQVFGFDMSEVNRAKALKSNYPSSKPIFPLIYKLLSKRDCIDILVKAGIDPPVTYSYGFQNNNCFLTGCVQGGIGYWQKMQTEFPDKFDTMAKLEHTLTDKAGKPVTMLKDQSKRKGLVFLRKHPGFPDVLDISQKKGRPPKPLFECNGFCGTNDLEPRNTTETEINYDLSNTV